MNAIAKVETKPKLMLLEFMADKYGLVPQQFADTVRKTCGLPTATAEEFAAFMMVAREYDLNPILREIHAFPKRGGGIVPVVAIDGWVNLVNKQPTCDGFEFEVAVDDDGKLFAITCRMFRKDRSHPVVVTEYLAECKRDSDPWKTMPHRMLRHKAMIQAARYAFGFSGIYDEDEGAKIAEMRDVTPMTRPVPPVPPAPPAAQITGASAIIDNDPNEITTDATAQSIDADQDETVDDGMIDDNQFFTDMDDAMAVAGDAATIEEIWTTADPLARFQIGPAAETNQGIAMAIKSKHLNRVGGSK